MILTYRGLGNWTGHMPQKSGKGLVNYYLKMAIDLEQRADWEKESDFKADLLARAKYSRQLANKEAEKLKTATPAAKPPTHE